MRALKFMACLFLFESVFMPESHRYFWRMCVYLVPLLPMYASHASASDERQLVQAINDFRGQPQRCEARMTKISRALTLNTSVALPINFAGSSRDALKASGYQAVTVRTIRLAGAQSAGEAFGMLEKRYCGALLDPQYADIGITRERGDWRVVLAKPLIDESLEDVRSAGRILLAQVNAARAKPRMCGKQPFPSARPLSWNTTLETAAQGHSQSMASENYFTHRGFDNDSPADRARAAGYGGRQIGENIAAGQSTVSKAMASWLASPGHCANLMNPMFTEVGAAYATATNADYGVYWTMLFGAP
ncbi:Allergen V5/Tpx-1 related protein [Pseudomonas savastanoi pv. glycinea]|uniref:Allergen V5/Tpx-1 related protein n=2 Tax=Pseudomonas savastanoi TaxID=29438 RepID=A0A3M5XQV1_PSESG|nr:Allergen V5/Tpx-1 related protein [Pseudomonas savastanoi pv. glycinea]RMT02895.1 Allergen V5/Tpx-1 related protein [Pseudomonas savastanoi pv. phaseolicola]RMU84033.1 Allergen V5/Tpx-1 related protein [Pseudomonas savastanoi pv. glycinea]RMV60109.1 Allergen V5/Tpx-1 related protein [Pseudomonas savastanoi pv. glycinea]